ncbi:crotonase [Subtercola boreus]|uniref:Crotonase n=1 Tax=Subtercola boreus TaxID=120213 RepID=A0A3E0VV40_9MICO|nr:enoyl-CoA hydratase/isomerase family protein [Subtercola boreus]RFA13213.1 crotonase [Subtercola boreus]
MSAPTVTGRIHAVVTDGLATVEIDNQTQRNALTRAMCLELQELMPHLDADPAITIIALRGAGSTFCAGASIGDLQGVLLDEQADGRRVDQLSLADAAIASMSKPTLALVDGACMGGGWQLASSCDFIVASERSTFAITPAKLGIIYPRPGIERLVRLVGPAAAKLILFAAEPFGAARAAELGLVAEVVPDESFDERARSLVRTIQSRSQFSTHTLKRLVDGAASEDAELDDHWAEAWSAMAGGPDMAIGVDAFLNRQEPRFVWTPAVR